MLLHIYNCDNDMALANFEPGYTPPANIRRFMQERERFPLTWAKPGDGVLTSEGVVLVGEGASTALQAERVVPLADVVHQIAEVRPWGWSPAICHRLRMLGVPEHLLPSYEQLCRLRELSSRRQAVWLLPRLVARSRACFVGESAFCVSADEVQAALQRWSPTILKAPWSSSGKGLRYGQGAQEETLAGWYRRILAQQGGVVVEPLYAKRCDFAMEFWSDGQGGVTYSGLSLFETNHNGAYSHNVYATEEEKMAQLTSVLVDAAAKSAPHADSCRKESASAFADVLTLLRKALEEELSALVGTAYRGPLGIDMMVLDDGRIHPCVEINLRMTMGYAALG